VLLNFNQEVSGGSCNGGDANKAYDFIYKYGITDDSCAPFVGLNWQVMLSYVRIYYENTLLVDRSTLSAVGV